MEVDEEMVVDEDIVFLIHYGEQTIRLELPAQERVESVKIHLMRKTGLLKAEMELLGWDIPDNVSDDVTFADLGISKEYHLVLRALNGADPDGERISVVYHLQVNDVENDEIYNLFFNGMQTVREVKQHVTQLCPIPFERQHWEGWPWPVDDDALLFNIGLKTPRHELQISRTRNVVRSPTSNDRSRSAGRNEPDHSYDMDEDDLDDDAIEISPPVPQRGSLLPNALLPPAEAIALFELNFEKRYGHNHVQFFKGSIREAMSFAFDRPVPDRQLFAIYLHNEKSFPVNIFVSQVLQNPVLIDRFRDHAVFWPWDVTLPESRATVQGELAEVIGEQAVIPLVTTRPDSFPILLICGKTKGSVDVLRVLDGTKSFTDVLDALELAGEIHRRNQENELAEQQTRERNRLVVEEQNQAYQASLVADQAKAEAKRAVEDQKRREEENVQEAIRQRALRQEEARAQLPEEPAQGSSDSITAVRLRTPDGRSLTRRFASSDPLQYLFRFAHANGYPEDEFNLVCSYPRKELGSLDKQKSFKELGLTQQIAIFVEEH
ncbi:FAS-associated factor 1 [Hypsibius exemplaris]|uniref:FAS-associated factor 1 n=1 Tax=Hypsibius exemplaris TaxID=2072580 RepID=A0A1W0X591_HYPEX|nr:FAS-associated factor 1 [Hypsibius exemplaris]